MSVVFFVGKNGYGKTHAVVQYGVIPCWAAGRTVVSNITLFPEELGYPEGLYQPLQDWHQIPRLGRHVKRVCRDCGWRARNELCRRCGGRPIEVPKLHPDGGLWSITRNEGVGLVLDEVTSVLPARDATNVPPELQRMLNQFRKPDIAPVLVSAPAWARADLMLREVCTHVVESRPLLPGLLSRTKAHAGSTWAEHRAFRRLWFDAFDYEDADTKGSLAALQPVKTKLLLSPSKRARVNSAYDTHEGVSLMDHIACAVCGGKFRREACKDPEGHRTFIRAERAKEADVLMSQIELELARVDTSEEDRDAVVLAQAVDQLGGGLGYVPGDVTHSTHHHDDHQGGPWDQLVG